MPSAPSQPTEGQITQLVFSIISKSREDDSLRCVLFNSFFFPVNRVQPQFSSLTPRLIRSKVENELELPSGSLNSQKVLVKRIIQDALVCLLYSFNPEEIDESDSTSHPQHRKGSNQPRDGKKNKLDSKSKDGECARPSASKSIKSKVRNVMLCLFFDLFSLSSPGNYHGL
jgi:hypothetical protein